MDTALPGEQIESSHLDFLGLHTRTFLLNNDHGRPIGRPADDRLDDDRFLLT